MTDMRSKLIAIVEVANEKCGFREGDHGVVTAVKDGFCAAGFQEADDGVAEAADSRAFCSIPVVSGPAFEDNGHGMRGQCPGRWRRWTPVARNLRIRGILSIVSCSRVCCGDKRNLECFQPRTLVRVHYGRRPEVAEVEYGQE